MLHGSFIIAVPCSKENQRMLRCHVILRFRWHAFNVQKLWNHLHIALSATLHGHSNTKGWHQPYVLMDPQGPAPRGTTLPSCSGPVDTVSILQDPRATLCINLWDTSADTSTQHRRHTWCHKKALPWISANQTELRDSAWSGSMGNSLM